MRERNRSGRGGRRRSGGDGEPDLFAKQLSEVVQQAFAATGGEAGVVETTVPREAPVEGRVGVPPTVPGVPPDTFPTPPPVEAPDRPGEVAVVQDAEWEAIEEPPVSQLSPQHHGLLAEPRISTIHYQPPPESLPARMLNEFVYCPRLFYYEHVEGVFVESAEIGRAHV